jgi:hypothetical protein
LCKVMKKESGYVGFSVTIRISALWTRLRLPSKMKIHSVLLLFRETTAQVMQYGRPFSVMTLSGVQVQVWTRLGLLLVSFMKIHNFFHIHLLLPYRVTEADTTPHL